MEKVTLPIFEDYSKKIFNLTVTKDEARKAINGKIFYICRRIFSSNVCCFQPLKNAGGEFFKSKFFCSLLFLFSVKFACRAKLPYYNLFIGSQFSGKFTRLAKLYCYKFILQSKFSNNFAQLAKLSHYILIMRFNFSLVFARQAKLLNKKVVKQAC